MIVVDSNIIVSVFIEGSYTELAEMARLREQWAAPCLWRSEFRSTLTKFVRAKLVSLSDAQEFLKQAEYLMLCRDFAVRGEKVLEYSSKSYGSAYDCEYVVLAEDFGIQMVTVDEPLIKHFPKIAVHLRDYVAG